LGTLTDINERINHWLCRQSFSVLRGPVVEHWKGVEESSGDGYLPPYEPFGEPGVSVDWEFKEIVGGLRKGSISFCGIFVRGLLSEDPERIWNVGSLWGLATLFMGAEMGKLV
jgi:hypothetical protein